MDRRPKIKKLDTRVAQYCSRKCREEVDKARNWRETRHGDPPLTEESAVVRGPPRGGGVSHVGLRGLAALGGGKRAKAPGQEQPRDQCGWSQGSEGKKEGSESGGWDRGAFVALRRPLERPVALTLKKLGSNGRI